MHIPFDDALAKDGKLDQSGTGENIDDILEAFKYTFNKRGNIIIPYVATGNFGKKFCKHSKWE